MFFVLRKPLPVDVRERVVAGIMKGFGGGCRFGVKRWIEVQFIPDGVTDIVRVRRSDGATSEGVVGHCNEEEIVSVLEQINAKASHWAEGSS